jgi:hypothetical protein
LAQPEASAQRAAARPPEERDVAAEPAVQDAAAEEVGVVARRAEGAAAVAQHAAGEEAAALAGAAAVRAGEVRRRAVPAVRAELPSALVWAFRRDRVLLSPAPLPAVRFGHAKKR